MGTQNVLGINYPYPNVGDNPWGVDHIDWATAVSDATNTIEAEVVTINTVTIPALQAQINLSGQANTNSNQGVGIGISLPKVGVDLPLKTFLAGTGIGLVDGADTVTINASSTGDVTGPVASINGNISTFNGVTGKIIKMSGVNIDGSDNVNVPGDLAVAGLTATNANTFRDTTSKTIASSTAALGNMAISSSSGGYSTTSGTYVAITNLSVDITTRGNPVKLYLINGTVGGSSSDQAAFGVAVVFKRDGVTVVGNDISIVMQCEVLSATTDPGLTIPGSCVMAIDSVAAGTYNYKLYGKIDVAGSQLNVGSCKLVAEEVV